MSQPRRATSFTRLCSRSASSFVPSPHFTHYLGCHVQSAFLLFDKPVEMCQLLFVHIFGEPLAGVGKRLTLTVELGPHAFGRVRITFSIIKREDFVHQYIGGKLPVLRCHAAREHTELHIVLSREHPLFFRSLILVPYSQLVGGEQLSQVGAQPFGPVLLRILLARGVQSPFCHFHTEGNLFGHTRSDNLAYLVGNILRQINFVEKSAVQHVHGRASTVLGHFLPLLAAEHL